MALTLADYQYLKAYLNAEQWLSPEQSFVRPADVVTYGAPTSTATGDLIGQSSVSAAACTPLEFDVPALDASDTVARGHIEWVRLRDTNSGAKTIRVHFIKAPQATPPTVTSVDNAAITFGTLQALQYLGYADVALQPSPRGGSYGQNDLIRIPYELDLSPGVLERLWTYHEALTAFTPGSASQFLERIAAARTR